MFFRNKFLLIVHFADYENQWNAISSVSNFKLIRVFHALINKSTIVKVREISINIYRIMAYHWFLAQVQYKQHKKKSYKIISVHKVR